jgi:hypothetical protein
MSAPILGFQPLTTVTSADGERTISWGHGIYREREVRGVRITWRGRDDSYLTSGEVQCRLAVDAHYVGSRNNPLIAAYANEAQELLAVVPPVVANAAARLCPLVGASALTQLANDPQLQASRSNRGLLPLQIEVGS